MVRRILPTRTKKFYFLLHCKVGVKRDAVACFEANKLTSHYNLSHHKIDFCLSQRRFSNSVLGFPVRDKVVGEKLET